MLAAERHTPYGHALSSLLEHEIDRVKDELVITDPGALFKLQGEIGGYQRILKYLKDRPVPTSQV
jgi:hypothetical protein